MVKSLHILYLCELERVSKGVIHMSLCGEMHDGVNLLCFQDIAYKLRAADIALHKLVIRVILDFVKIL